MEAVKEKRMRTNQRKKAFKIGIRVDELIKTNEFPSMKDSDEVRNAFASWIEWKENYSPRTIEIGERLYNDEIMITGEPDLYFNGVEINDIKCASSIRFEYWVQLGGYLLLPNHRKIERVSILRLDKKSGEYEYKVRTDLDVLRTLFVGEVNKVREYLKWEGEYDRSEMYHTRSVGAVEREVEPEFELE